MKSESFFKKYVAVTLLAGWMFLAALFIPGSGFGATHDLTGTWNYTLSGCWAQGDEGCAPGPAASGTCEINQTGDVFTFAFTSGVTCSPPGCCTFEGTVSGVVYSCSTTEVVDSEGGTATSTMTFTASSATAASGSGTSVYLHPSSDWTCNWGNTITLTRADDTDTGTRYRLTVETIGNGAVTLDPAGGLYDPGTTVELTAAAAAGWEFKGWSGDMAASAVSPATVAMDADRVVTATFRASDIGLVNISGLSASASGNVGVGDTVTYTVSSGNPLGSPVYYRWYYRTGYGTAGYDTAPWVVVQRYSTAASCDYSFPAEGSYIVVVRAVTDTENEPSYLAISGHVVTVGNGTPVNLGGVSSSASGTVTAGETVTFSVTGSTSSGNTIYYKWFYCADYGTSEYESSPWVVVQDYSTAADCSYVFPAAGSYVVVVRGVTDPADEPAALPISGCVVNVE